MTSILFEGTPNAYLPEISAYRHYLSLHYPNIKTFDSRESSYVACDVIWRFMGIDRKPPETGKFLVHEYNSLSTGRMALIKNAVKRYFNSRPHRRIFLNNSVQSGFPFQDNTPFRLRDMGIDPTFFVPSQNKEFDFIYVGSLDRGKIIERFLDYFAKEMKDSTLVLIGSADETLQDRYKPYLNITFKGRIPYSDVPAYMAQARYGLNLMPDQYPFNLQTSTKLLEYCAAGLGIVSSRYQWAEQFSNERSARFFWLNPDFSGLSAKNLQSFNWHTPDVSHLTWDRVIDKSGVFDFLKAA